MGAIVDIQMARLAEAARRSQDRARALDEARADWLADKGYDPAYGARPLKRVIQKPVQDPLAEPSSPARSVDGETVPVTVRPRGLMLGRRHGRKGEAAGGRAAMNLDPSWAALSGLTSGASARQSGRVCSWS